MLEGKEFIEYSKLVEILHGRRMNSVSTKVAEKVRPFLKHGDIDARTCKQISKHNPRRPPARDGNLGGDVSVHE